MHTLETGLESREQALIGTGKRVKFAICVLLEFDSDGRIVSVDRYTDHLSAMISIGAVRLPAPTVATFG